MYVSLFEQCYVSNKNKITSLAISYTGAHFLDLHADLEEGMGEFAAVYMVRKSFQEFQKSVYIHELLHKIFCNRGLYTSEILSAFRICAILKAGITNKVYKPL